MSTPGRYIHGYMTGAPCAPSPLHGFAHMETSDIAWLRELDSYMEDLHMFLKQGGVVESFTNAPSVAIMPIASKQIRYRHGIDMKSKENVEISKRIIRNAKAIMKAAPLKFSPSEKDQPFFSKQLFAALTLAVEHEL